MRQHSTMPVFRLSLILAMAVWVCGASVYASPTATGSVPITITLADLDRLVQAHPQVAAANKEIAAAKGEHRSAGALPNPSLEATVAHATANRGNESAVEWGLALEIPIGWMATRSKAKAASASGVRMAEAEARILARELRIQLHELFWRLVYEQERVATLMELHKEMADLADKQRKRAEKGEIRAIEVTRMEIEAQKSEGDLEAAQIQKQVRQAQLALWLMAAPSTSLVAVAPFYELPAVTAPVSIDEQNPWLMRILQEEQGLAANIAIARRERFPEMSLSPFYERELDKSGFGVALATELPMWNWNKGAIATAEALHGAGQENAKAQQLAWQSTFIENRAACDTALKQAQRYRNQIEPKAVSAAKTIERTYEIGECTLLEAIDGRRMLVETKMETLEVLALAHLECNRLNIQFGEDNDNDNTK